MEEYQIIVTNEYSVFVEADSEEEAKENYMDTFQDTELRHKDFYIVYIKKLKD